jgi:hypothetical protein
MKTINEHQLAKLKQALAETLDLSALSTEFGEDHAACAASHIAKLITEALDEES